MPIQVIRGEMGGLKPDAFKMAMPGTFWEVMVTIKRGMPTLIKAANENSGRVQVGDDNANWRLSK